MASIASLQQCSSFRLLKSTSNVSKIPICSYSKRSRSSSLPVLCQLSQQSDAKTLVVKNTPAELPFPWSEKDPYKIPVSIDRVQKMLLGFGWEKPWVEQIIDRIMKAMLKTSEDRAKAVIDYLLSLGLRQDEICNMASISVVLLGLNPETRLRPVVDYLMQRGVPNSCIPDVALKHPRIFEYKVEEGGKALAKKDARIKVDAIKSPSGDVVANVTYYRVGTSFLTAPVSPVPPMDMV